MTGKYITFGTSDWGSQNPFKPTTMNWGFESNLTSMLTRNRLVELGAGQKMYPGIAEKWDISPDATKYTYYLRKDVKFSDGTPLTTADVAATVKLYLTKDANINPLYWTNNIKGGKDFFDGKSKEIPGLQVKDDYTITFELSEPYGGWDGASTAEMGILPAHIFKNVNPLDLKEEMSPTWFKPEINMGSGPFKFVKAERNQYIQLARNDIYYQGKPKLDGILIKNLGGADTQFIALQKGELDVWNTPSAYVDQVSKLTNVNIYRINRLYHRMMRINWQKPYLSDKRVRQAMLYALDRKALCDLQANICFPWNSFMQQTEFVPKDLNPYEYNPDKAKQLLKEAGWNPNQEIKITYYYADSTHKNLFAAIQQYLAAVGVKAQLVLMEGAAWTEGKKNCDFDWAYEGFGTSHVTAYGDWFISDTGCAAMWNKPDVADLFKKVKATGDSKVQYQYLEQLQRMVSDELPVYPMFKYIAVIAVNKRVTGLTDDSIWLMQALFNTGYNNAHNWDVTG